MKSKKQWLPFIILNIIVSAATVLVVLFVWNRINPSKELTLQYPQSTPDNVTQINPAVTLPALDEETIKISNVIAAGDYQNEYQDDVFLGGLFRHCMSFLRIYYLFNHCDGSRGLPL